MPRTAAVAIENNFSAGLITEATGLNFPENACTETYNCVFDITGEVSRRPGFALEPDYVVAPLNLANSAITRFTWKAVAGDGNLNIEVVQTGLILSFYVVQNQTSLSPGRLSGTVDLSVFAAPGASVDDIKTTEAQFAYGNGKLFVVHSLCDPFFVSYDLDTQGLTTTFITIQTRDFKRLEDATQSIDERPNTLTTEHEYNLRNQGWEQAIYTVSGGGSIPADFSSRVDEFRRQVGTYPSNTDVWWMFKGPNKDGKIIFKPGELRTLVTRGSSPAPNGFYILEAFNQDRSAVSGIPGIDVITSGAARPSTVAFFAGRVFYGGVKAEGFNSKIYFTQIIEEDNQYGHCYQQNDPTSETFFDLLPTDGGVISSPDIGDIIRLFPVGNNLVIIASNGLWAITGNQGIGFTANDYSIKPLDNTNGLSNSSVVSIAGTPSFWNHEGIWTIQASAQGLSVSNIVDKKINKFYQDIPSDSKLYAKGIFNPVERTVQWLYRSTSPTTVSERYQYDRVLNLNILNGAFYPWTITMSPGTPVICGLTVVQGQGLEFMEDDVTTNEGDGVVTDTGDQITTNIYTSTAVSSKYVYLTETGAGVTWSHTLPDFKDWGAVQYSSYFLSGYKVHGDAQKKFQTNYVYVYTANETNSSFTFQSRWDYAANSRSNRFSTEQRVIVNDDVADHMYRRLKVRGHGVACQFRFASIEDEPFNLVGWSVFETGNQRI